MKELRLKKLMTGFLIGTMALVLCLCTAAAVFAGNETLPKGTAEKPAGAAITKVLQMPQGTATPNAAFTFNIQKLSVDGDTSAEVLNKMPKLEGSISVAADSISTLDGDKKIVTKNTGNLLAGKSWPHAGEYVYQITETANTYTIADSNKESLVYSQSEYKLHVYIAEAASGALYVKSAGAVIVKNQNGKAEGDGGKVDPSVPTEVTEGNSLKFVNTYANTAGSGEAPDPDKQSAAVSKAVTGELASKTKYFPFEVTISNNSLISKASYKAYICTLNRSSYQKVSKAEANNQYDDGKDFVTFTVGMKKDITLKHGQYLVFMDCPKGTVYNANEKAVPGYKAAVHIVTGGTAISPDPSNTAANTALSTGERVITAGGANTAAFTNTYATTVPTGIIIDNLPFIAMILIAIGAFIVFIVGKRRKRAR